MANNSYIDPISLERPDVSFSNDVAGFQETKELLREALKKTRSTSDANGSWSSILLYGAPGAGKSYIAKGLVSEADNMEFYHMHAYEFMSKYVDGKQMSSLFRRARENQPCIIMLDDIDAFSKARSEGRSERGQEVKAEFLSEVQAVNNGILLMATTCLPWDIDKTILDCFNTKIHINLPDIDARREMILMNLKKTPHDLTDGDILQIAAETDGYTPADLSILIRDALMEPVRKIQKATHYKRVTGPSPEDPEIIVDDLLEPCPPDYLGAVAMTWVDVPADKIHVPHLSMSDLLKCLLKTKPTVIAEEIEKYKMFESTSGD